MSREPSDSHKIQAQSIPETKDAFDAAVKQVARTVSFRGRKLRGGPLLNAIVIHYLGLPESERERIASENLAIYESLLDHDDPRDDLLRSMLADAVKARAASLGQAPRADDGRGVDAVLIPVEGKITKSQAKRKRADSTH